MAFSIFVEKNNYLKWVSIFLITLKRMLRLLVKNLALNLILRIWLNSNINMLFILVNVECREKNCSDDYHGESARRISERIIYHGGKDKKSIFLCKL